MTLQDLFVQRLADELKRGEAGDLLAVANAYHSIKAANLALLDQQPETDVEAESAPEPDGIVVRPEFSAVWRGEERVGTICHPNPIHDRFRAYHGETATTTYHGSFAEAVASFSEAQR